MIANISWSNILTDPEALRAVVPEPLEIIEPIVKFEFIRLPDTTGFGDFTECGQMIPRRLPGAKREPTFIRCISTTKLRLRRAAKFGGFRKNSLV